MSDYWNELSGDLSALGGLPVYTTIVLLFVALRDPLALPLFIGLVLCYGITIVSRLLYFKPRPNPKKYRTTAERIDASSFPSLHSMRATVLAGMLGLHFNQPATWGVFGLLWLLVCSMRIRLKKHDYTDVVGGILIGLLVVLGLQTFF